MQYIDNLLEKRKYVSIDVGHFIYHLSSNGVKIPDILANLIDSPVGKIVVALVALLLFGYSNPILGVLGIMVAYHLIKASSDKTGTAALEQHYPTEEKKWSPFTAIHQFPYTLEQEVVKQMASQKFNANYVKAPYRPMLNDTHDASLVA
jgi:hypothetical protein